MKKQITKGIVIGAIVALVIVIYFINFPKYTCQQVPVGQPVNCNRMIDVTTGFILESFAICMIIGGGVGWIYSRNRCDKIIK